MTNANDKPSVGMRISIGLVNSTNRQALREFQDELERAGYTTGLDIEPPSGQFSASLEIVHVYIVAGGSALTGLIVKDVYDGLKKLVRKLVRSKRSDHNPEVTVSIPIGDEFAVGIVVETDDGKQHLNLLVRDVDNIKELPTRPDKPHGQIKDKAPDPRDDG